MVSNNTTAVLDSARDLDTVLHPAAYPHRSLSALRLWIAPTPSIEYDLERATWIPLQESRNGYALETDEIANSSLASMPTARVSTSRISDTTNTPCSHVNYSGMSDGPPVRGEETTDSVPNEEQTTVNPTLACRILSSFTLYGELAMASTPEQFASVHARLRQEWSFDGGFLIGIAAVNVAIFAITPGSIFKIDSYAHSAVATSSAACGVGIACDAWFLVRYNWVNLETFIYHSRDVYGSYLSFSLSSRMPTFCMLLSSISLMSFLGLTAFDASPAGVLVIAVLVVLAMTMQYIVYGTHLSATSALHIWRARATPMVNVIKRLRGFARGG